ncbi:hypothetical protein [Nocardia iowensis]|uniref:Uncharacterized protein n=1 Tax=Nocardia iowensis TaxID=204891 RepID=A0ABX8RQG6_NOCIO|nr:hypothetical protein [Nocardia iowensis]QXN91883.1 hypothetical protein KV110_01430 [Nocardia iowensis]
MPDLSHPDWGNTTQLLAVIVLTPVITLTVLTALTALVAVISSKKCGDRAIRVFESTLEALLWLMGAVLRVHRRQEPQRNRQPRNRFRR